MQQDQDAELVAYLRDVHTNLARKRIEIVALMVRFEPPEPKVSVSVEKPRPAADERQLPHIQRRYDEALTRIRGYWYNPARAYFDRDAFGTGLLVFREQQEAVSLLGTSPAQDRWRFATGPDGPVAGSVHREARQDAIFAMLERRQAMTELVGMAPTCVFVGQDVSAPISPPRPAHRRISIHRYQRICFSATARDPETPANNILCAVIAERFESRWRLHVMSSGAPVTTGTAWHEPVAIAVTNQWYAITQHRQRYRMFDEKPVPGAAESRIRSVQASGVVYWPLACPGGDSEMFFRLSILLESPDLNYAPWHDGLMVGSLPAVLEAAPPIGMNAMLDLGFPKTKTSEKERKLRANTETKLNQMFALAGMDAGTTLGAPLVPEYWLQYTVMARVFPYTMLAATDMKQRMKYRPWNENTSLNPTEFQTFRDSIRPVSETEWVDPLALKRVRRKPVGAQPPVIARSHPPPPSPTTEQAVLAFVEELYGYRAGSLLERFGPAALAWYRNKKGEPGPNQLLVMGRVRMRLGGLGRDPDPASPHLWMGWSSNEAALVSRAQITIRYEWTPSNKKEPAGKDFESGRGLQHLSPIQTQLASCGLIVYSVLPPSSSSVSEI